MRAIVIEEETFQRIFDDCARDLDFAALEEKDRVRPAGGPASEQWSAINAAHRKFIYAIRRAQDRLRSER